MFCWLHHKDSYLPIPDNPTPSPFADPLSSSETESFTITVVPRKQAPTAILVIIIRVHNVTQSNHLKMIWELKFRFCIGVVG